MESKVDLVQSALHTLVAAAVFVFIWLTVQLFFLGGVLTIKVSTKRKSKAIPTIPSSEACASYSVQVLKAS